MQTAAPWFIIEETAEDVPEPESKEVSLIVTTVTDDLY